MKKCNIEFGCKTTGPTKGLLVPLPDHCDTNEYDILLPENENKIKLSAEKLADLMRIVPGLAPSHLFSRNLRRKFAEKMGKNPKESWDLCSILGKMPSQGFIEEVRAIYEGIAEPGTIANMLFCYEDKAGVKKYTKTGEKVLAGQSIFNDDIWPEAAKSLVTAFQSAIQPCIDGIYGVVMPMGLLECYGEVETESISGWITRFPWIVPILTKVKVYKDCIFVDEELWSCYGGDYDGDQGAVFGLHAIKGHLSWKDSKNHANIKEWMSLPTKEEATDDMSYMEVIASQLDQYRICGMTYNACRVAEDGARYRGMSTNDILEMSIRMQAIEVQPLIDGFKYKAKKNNVITNDDLLKYDKGFANFVAELKEPTQFEKEKIRLTMTAKQMHFMHRWLDEHYPEEATKDSDKLWYWKAIYDKRCSISKDVKHVKTFFGAVRGASSFEHLVELADKADPNSKSFYALFA